MFWGYFHFGPYIYMGKYLNEHVLKNQGLNEIVFGFEEKSVFFSFKL